MKTSLMNYVVAAALAAVVALSAATTSFAQQRRTWDGSCIPQYDSSGAQTAPYC